MPTIVSGSISILSDAGLGMAMFSLGIYLQLTPLYIDLNFPCKSILQMKFAFLTTVFFSFQDYSWLYNQRS